MHFIPALKIFQQQVLVESSKSFDYKSSIEVNKSHLQMCTYKFFHDRTICLH